MYVFSIFEHSSKLEMAVTELQLKGIQKEAILAVPLDRRNEGRLLFDTVHSSDSTSMMTFPMLLGMIFTFFGSIFGFSLIWGPILWGVIGAASGFLLGLGIRLIYAVIKKEKQNSEKKAGVILVVRCDKDQTDMAKDILWTNTAMGVSKLSI